MERLRTLLLGMLAVTLLSAPAWAVLDASKLLTQYVHEDWTTKNGLPQTSVLALAQTPDGYVWAGTEDGLVRFDGVRFVTFNRRNTPAFRSNVVDALFVDQRGVLWIGTIGGGLVSFRKGIFEAFGGLAADTILSLHEDEREDLWVGTDGAGLARIHNGQVQTYRHTDGLPDDSVFSLCGDRHGGVWMGTHSGLGHWSNGHFSVKTKKDGLPDDYVRSVYVDRAGKVWVGTNRDGLARITGDQVVSYTVKDGLSDNRVWSILEDSKGTLWIGTSRGGINRFRNGVFSHLGSAEGFSGDDIWALLEDREGSLWVGSAGGGMSRLHSGRFSTVGKREGLSSDVALPVFQDREGALWVGTADAGVNRFQAGKLSVLTTKDGLSDNQVFSIAEDSLGDHWFGTRKGLNRLHNGKFISYTGTSGLPNDVPVCLYADSRGNLWVGTRAGLSRFDGSTFRTFTQADGLSNNDVHSIYEDPRDGTLWIGTGGGLNHFVNGQIRAYGKKDGLSSDFISSILEDSDGTLWLATNGGGLNRFRDGKFAAFGTQDGLFDDAISVILDDGKGDLWMSSNRGVFRVSKEQLNAFADHRIEQISSYNYGTADGLRSPECNGGFQPAGWRLQDGSLAFPTMRGLAIVQPKRAVEGAPGPPVLLENVIVDRRSYATGGTLSPPAGKGQMEFQYTALSFQQPAEIRFRYMLEGFDKDWTEAGTRRTAYYTNIPPGSYRFLVMARSVDGAWSPGEATVSVLIPKHFYQTLWFFFLEGAVIVGLITFAYEWRVRQLRANETRLMALIEERTLELARKEKKFRQLAEHIHEVFWIVDTSSGAMIYVSPAFQSLWGLAPELVLQDPAVWFTAIHPDDRAKAEETRYRQRQGELAECEYRVVRADRTHWVFDRGFPIRDANGVLERVVGVVEDITQRNQAEEVLRRSNEELEQRVAERTVDLQNLNGALEKANRSKDEFLANMSHELRTPMNGVIGMTRLALATQLDLEQKEYLENVSSSANSLLTIIDDILDFTRVESQKLTFEKSEFEVKATLSQIVLPFEAKAREKGLAFEFSLAEDVPAHLVGDPNRLRQVLGNLLKNAVKFTPSGSVSTHVSLDNRTEANATLRFCVADTGIGIADDKHSIIFEAFTQVDTSFKREFGGTGMGLALAAKLSELMGGGMWLESTLGEGSRFYFTAVLDLPVPKTTPQAAKSPEPTSAPGAQTALRVLLVEDNLVNQKVAKRLLEKNGCEVTAALNGRLALEALEHLGWNVDVVFMDVQMPEMDGLSATREIRRLETAHGKHLPIFALTAHAGEQDRADCLAAGMDAHLTKPIQVEKLQAALRQVASGHFHATLVT